MFDPLSEGELRDPHALYDRLRREDPVHYNEGLRAWIVSRHGHVRRILADHRTFAADFRKVGESVPAEAINIQLLDPPDHYNVRQAVTRGYSAQNWEALGQLVAREIAVRLDHAAGRAEVDFVQDVAVPVAGVAVLSLLGLTGLDRAAQQEYSDAIVDAMNSGLNLGAAAPGASARRMLTDMVAREYAKADSAGLSRWLRDNVPDGVPAAVIVNTLRVMLHAGYSSLPKLLANAVHTALTDPSGTLAQIREGPPPNWCREFLRLATPIHALTRVCVADADVGGKRVRANQDVVVFLAAANRDPEVFPDPHVLRLGRDSSATLTFGSGAHHCSGASLVTQTLEACLTQIAGRFPRSRVLQEPVPRRNAVLRGPTRLLVRLSAGQKSGGGGPTLSAKSRG